MLTEEQVRRAKRLNRVYAQGVRPVSGGRQGWSHRYTQIAQVLGHAAPTSPGEEEFVRLVAAWQETQRLEPPDGVLGQNTWARLEPLTRFTPDTSAPVPGWMTAPLPRIEQVAQSATPTLAGSTFRVPGRGWMFVVVEELPEVGSRNVIRKVAVVPRDFVLRPSAPRGSLRPALHALGDAPNASQFLSASNRPFGSVTGGHGDTGLLIDLMKVERAGGRIVSEADLIADLMDFGAQNPNARPRVDLLTETIRNFEGETLIEGSPPRGAVRQVSAAHAEYLRVGEAIFEEVRAGRITRAQGAEQLRALEGAYGRARVVGRVGRGLMVIGFVMTAVDVGVATEASVRERSLRPIAAEGIRQVGGWGAGLAGAKIGFVGGAALGIETGPGAIVTGAVGAIIFGFAGYTGADWVADLIYEN